MIAANPNVVYGLQFSASRFNFVAMEFLMSNPVKTSPIFKSRIDPKPS
jgi:hypothetical protein